MNREEAKRCTVKIRATFVSIKEQMRHKGEVPIGRANSIGSQSEPILPPRAEEETNRRYVSAITNFQLAAKILPTRYNSLRFFEIFPYSNISIPPFPFFNIRIFYIYIYIFVRREEISFYTRDISTEAKVAFNISIVPPPSLFPLFFKPKYPTF